MKKWKKQSITVLLTGIMLLTGIFPAAAATNGGHASGIQPGMEKASFWKERIAESADTVLMTAEEIAAMNERIVEAPGTYVFDLTKIEKTYNAAELRKSLAGGAIPTGEFYVKGKKIDNESYFSAIYETIEKTGYSAPKRENTYAVAVRHANLKAFPTNDVIGDSADDANDEMQSSALLVNEPFVIRQKCEREGDIFYWGYSDHVDGWVNGKDLAICANREEWLDAWQVKTDGKDFLVVTQDKLVLDQSLTVPETSGVELMIGTVLKLVEAENIPKMIGDRGTWNNHVVYLPVRNENGSYRKQMALISEHCQVSIGYLPLTQANMLELLFSCLGNRYGWGDMLESMDCSSFVRNLYHCCGLALPRNTTWQELIPGTRLDLSYMTDEEKERCIEGLPIGTALYFPGHTMMYIGSAQGVGYVISDTGNLVDAVGETKFRRMHNVIEAPLTVRRRNGDTWLHYLTAAVVLPERKWMADCEVIADGADDVRVSYKGTALQEGKDYTLLKVEDGIVSAIGAGEYIGSKRAEIPMQLDFGDISREDYFYHAVAWAVKNGIASGVDAVHFAPDAECSREQMLTLLWRAAGCPEPVSMENTFSDVEPGGYYEKAVLWGVENGYVKGTGDDTFGTGESVTRGQAVTFLARLAGNEEGDAEMVWFADVDADAYYAASIAWAVKNNVAAGLDERTFAPDAPCLRGQIVALLARWFEK